MDSSDLYSAKRAVKESTSRFQSSNRVDLQTLNTEVKTKLDDAIEERMYGCFDGSGIGNKAEPKIYFEETVVKSEYLNDSDNVIVKELEVEGMTHADEKPHKCIICDYSCESLLDIKQHIMDTHMGEKPYKCGMCNYAGTDIRNLRVHMRLHIMVKPYKCNICEYVGRNKPLLKSHMRKHTGVKPFKCTLCPYAAPVASVLKQHIRTHTGEKPYKCTNCDYSAAQSILIHRHMRKHRGENYKCTMCEHVTLDANSLKRHIQKIHMEDKQYMCNTCNYKAKKSSLLQKHKIKCVPQSEQGSK